MPLPNKYSKALQNALDQLEITQEAYCDLVARSYLAICCYENYLLDRADHRELAETMKDLFAALPKKTRDGLRGPDKPPTGLYRSE